jgi:hypothetical protein
MLVAAVVVLVVVGAAQAADLVTFVQLVARSGPRAEANPLVAHGLLNVGLGTLVVAKIALVVLVVATFVIVARRHRRMAALVASIATLAGLVGAVANLAAIG